MEQILRLIIHFLPHRRPELVQCFPYSLCFTLSKENLIVNDHMGKNLLCPLGKHKLVGKLCEQLRSLSSPGEIRPLAGLGLCPALAEQVLSEGL